MGAAGWEGLEVQDALFEESPQGPGLEIEVLRRALEPRVADAAFASLRASVPWRQERLVMFGREVDVPRLEAWIADPGLSYTYSGVRHEPQPWSDDLMALRDLVTTIAGEPFNAVLCNLYRDGSDGVDWHADDERELGDEPVIGSVSLGASRRFDLRRVDDHSIRASVELHHGDVIIMRGTTQALWRHRVPRTKKPVGERINLTFRRVLRAS